MMICATPSFRVSDFISSRICAWMVTSSAVVGSSAMISLGLQASAMAIITRWRMPPESWCGYCRSRRCGSAMPTISSSSTARFSAVGAVRALVLLQRLGDLPADGQHGIERGHRLLEHHADVAAAHLRASPPRSGCAGRARRTGPRRPRSGPADRGSGAGSTAPRPTCRSRFRPRSPRSRPLRRYRKCRRRRGRRPHRCEIRYEVPVPPAMAAYGLPAPV